MTEQADESYEVAFNRAFIALEGGDWRTAETRLTQAERTSRLSAVGCRWLW